MTKGEVIEVIEKKYPIFLDQKETIYKDYLKNRPLFIVFVGQIGGVFRRWEKYLIEVLTGFALRKSNGGREKVREWQKEIFGKSCASRGLKLYADPFRSGGGRALEIKTESEEIEWVKKIYDEYSQKIRHVVKYPYPTENPTQNTP